VNIGLVAGALRGVAAGLSSWSHNVLGDLEKTHKEVASGAGEMSSGWD
jgi:hypothetical protein